MDVNTRKRLSLLLAAFPMVSIAAPTDTPQQLESVTVTASADASQKGLSSAYEGGQVARGQSYGLLGNQDYLDIPYNGTAYTSNYASDIQAEGIGDILENDPDVRVGRGFGNYQESYFIRGFIAYSDEISYNGLYGILPRQYVSSELVERTEVLKGASTFLNGVSPGAGAIGGTINLMPKRAPNQPLTNISVGTNGDGQAYIAADIARRLGANNQHGVRVNLVHRDGDTAVDHEAELTNLASIGYDWRGNTTRISADFAYQEHKNKRTRPTVTVSAGSGIPSLHKISDNWSQPWVFSNEYDLFGTLHAEHDLSPTTTVWAGVGVRQSREESSLANLTMTNSDSGAATAYRADTNREDVAWSANSGIRGELETGPISHKWNVAASIYQLRSDNAYAWGSSYNTNIYSTPHIARPANTASVGGNMHNPGTTQRLRLPSIAFSDTLGFFDEQLLVTLGGRYQHIDIRGYDYNSGDRNSKSSQTRFSPSAGILYKLTPDLSVYGNYSESLRDGGTVTSTTATNQGQTLDPFVSRQEEIGLKYDGGNLGTTLALFTTARPSTIERNNRVSSDGENRHSGIEWSFFGKLTRDLKVLGGATYLNAKQKRNDSGTEGKDVIGVAHLQGNLGLDWNLPYVDGLSVNARMSATGSRYADAENTLKVGGWTRYDLGAKYTTVVDNHELIVRGQIKNLFNRGYWTSVGGYPGSGYLVASDPRSFNVNATMKF